MITIEESGFKRGDELVFPLGLTLSADKGKTVTACPEAKDAAEYLEGLDEAEIFTENTKSVLSGMLFERFSELGYDTEIVFSTEFILKSRDKVARSLILPSSEPLLPENQYENLTDCQPDPLGEGLLCFGTVIDGRIVSAAAENPHFSDDGVVDIGVETAEGYEGNGYAASNVASLAYYLLDPGVFVTYIADDENRASLRVAEKVGFTPETKELRVICCLKNRD